VRRSIVLLLFTALFVAELGWAGIAPLLPTYRDTYGLTAVATSLILTVASLGLLLVCLPAGALSSRVAVRTLTLWGIASLTIGNLLVGLAGPFPVLLFGRLLTGVGLGMMWVTGTAWLHVSAGASSARALAFTTTVAGAGGLAGPSIVGWLGDRYGPGTAFVVLAALNGLMLVLLSVVRSPEGREVEPSPPLREMLRAARADHLMLTSLVLTLAVSVMWMSTDLLIPLRLDALGFDAAQIGLVFSGASILFVGSSALTSARAERYATVRAAAIWTVLYAVCVLVAAVGDGAVASGAFLAAVGVTTGVMISLTFPIGVRGAEQRGVNVAVVGALLTLVWAISGMVGPALGGAVAERVGDQRWYLLLAVFGFATAAWMWVRRDRAAPPAGVELGEPAGAHSD
jgi:predicted MFS family arabinose efflux permease